MFSGWDRPSHWVVIAVIALVLFGYKKLPDASRSLGRSLRIFKTEMKGMTEDDKAREATPSESDAVAVDSSTDAAPSLPAADATPAADVPAEVPEVPAEVPGPGSVESKGESATS